MAGATSTLLYGVNLLFHPVNPPPPTEDGTLTGRPRVGAPYHVRVLVPCYKESLDIVAKTLEAALAAELPAGCGRTVYLLDDGKQRDKRKWCATVWRDRAWVE
jgi:endoglucanase